MFAGACAGIMEHIVMYPVDCVKTRMQCLRSAGGSNSPGVLTGLYRLVLHEGILRSLKGSGAVIWGAGPAHAAYFGCYEKMKSFLATAPIGSSHVNHMIAGTCATLLHDAVMTPADAVKQRLQIYNSPYHNTLDCLRRVCISEGPSVLYRAYFTQLSMNIPYQTIHFVCYEHAQSLINPTRQYQPWTHVVSGGVAGCFAAAFTNPLDVCKTVLNTQDRYVSMNVCRNHFTQSSKTEFRGLVSTAMYIYQMAGLKGFTRGISARILTAVPGTALSWSVYEYFKWRLKDPTKPSGSSDFGGSNGTGSGACSVHKIELSPMETLCVTASSNWMPNSTDLTYTAAHTVSTAPNARSSVQEKSQ
ncbi:Mitoferrin-2 [Schistosoma japonicum]|nr:Mitoferrin-2 [Schistosoma japonicum]KAH8872394.1 Mitoferrin-2 [Schistosoma japonicum]